MLDALLSPDALFGERPDRAVAVALAFLAGFAALRVARVRLPQVNERPLLLAAAGWLILALNEYVIAGGAPGLRVDLVFLWPLVLLLSVVCLALTATSIVVAVRMRRRR